MRKADVLKVYKTNVAVADALGISDAAVSQWDEIIPPLAAHELAKKDERLKFDPSLYEHASPQRRQVVAMLAELPNASS